MSLAMLTLAFLASSLCSAPSPPASQAQIPPGPLNGPNGGPLDIHDIELSGSAHWLLGTELVMSERRPVVGVIDAAGTVIWTPPLPAALMPTGSPNARLLAVGENRILVKDETRTYRTYELTIQGWAEELTLTPTMHGGAYMPVAGDISGSTVVLSTPHHHARPIVVDAATSSVQASLPVTPGSSAWQIAVDGDTAVAVEVQWVIQPSGAYSFEFLGIPVFRKVGVQWVRVGEIESPTGLGWRERPTITFDGDTIAVSARSVSPTEPCPKLYLFEKDPSGAFVFSAEFEAASPCATSLIAGIAYYGVNLLGSELAAVEGLDGRADRFERTAAGWMRRERVASERQLATAWPINGQLLGTRSFGSPNVGQAEVFASVDSPGQTAIACAPSVPILSALVPSGRTRTSVDPRWFYWTVQAAPMGTPYFFAVGFQSGSRPLGPTAELCISGGVALLPPTSTYIQYGNDVARLMLDPVAAGLLPGQTLYVQAWRPEASMPGGLTSNSVSVLFAP